MCPDNKRKFRIEYIKKDQFALEEVKSLIDQHGLALIDFLDIFLSSCDTNQEVSRESL